MCQYQYPYYRLSTKVSPLPVQRLPYKNSELIVSGECIAISIITGFQDRVETGVEWVLLEEAVRHHKAQSLRKDIPTVGFSKALENKIKNSIIGEFLDTESSLTLQQRWEVTLPMTIFDIEKCADKEGKICFLSTNSITDEPKALIRYAVIANNEKVLKDELTKIRVLRVIDSKV